MIAGVVAASEVRAGGGASNLSYKNEVLADAPLFYYRFNETTGFDAADSSGNSRTGTISGSGLTLGSAGLLLLDPDKSLTFPGSSGMVTPGAFASWQQQAVWSATGLFKTTGVSGIKTLIARYPGTIAGGSWTIRLDNDKLAGYSFSGSSFASIVGTTTIVANTIYHFAAVYNGTNLLIYLNGNFEGSVAGPQNVSTSSISIGQRFNNGEYFSGPLDEIAYFGSALSPERVSAEYAATVRAA